MRIANRPPYLTTGRQELRRYITDIASTFSVDLSLLRYCYSYHRLMGKTSKILNVTLYKFILRQSCRQILTMNIIYSQIGHVTTVSNIISPHVTSFSSLKIMGSFQCYSLQVV